MTRKAESETVNIDGENYTFQYLNTSDALEICGEVSQKILPVLGKMAEKDGADKELGDFKFAEIAGAVAASFEPKALMVLVKRLCAVVLVSPGGIIKFDEHFRGRPGHALKVAKHSFEVNCGDFFDAAASLAGISLKEVMTPAPSKQTGGSGG